MIFETHAHYEDHAFDEDREAILAELPEKGISPVINVGSKLSTTEESVVLAQKYDYIYAAVGIHPSEIGDLDLGQTMKRLRELAAYEKTVAIGEIGLDYYWDKEDEIREKQRVWFKTQLDLADETGLPVIIHSRDAAEDTMQILKQRGYRENAGVVHCYSYSPEQALEYIKLGYCIGVGGVVTFKNAKKLVETVRQIPLESILLETDCPYMAPEPVRGTRNDSRNIPYMIEKISQIKGISPEEIEKGTRENAFHLFSRAR